MRQAGDTKNYRRALTNRKRCAGRRSTLHGVVFVIWLQPSRALNKLHIAALLLVKFAEVMDRPVTAADAETIGGCDCRRHPRLGVAHGGLKVIALGKPGRNGR